jgi:hypothetical protein
MDDARLPSKNPEMSDFSLRWAAARTSFLSTELQHAISKHFVLSNMELKFKSETAREPLFQNSTSHLLNDWRHKKYLADYRAIKHKNSQVPYFITEAGIAAASEPRPVRMIQPLMFGILTTLLRGPDGSGIPDAKAPALRLIVSEGALTSREVEIPYRDDSIVDAKLAQNLADHERYTCEDCRYQPDGDAEIASKYDSSIHREISGMLDVHHIIPIELGERKTSLSDLTVLCPLCHRRRRLLLNL